MLREIPDIYQIPGEPFRRWFTGEDMDLIIWYYDDLYSFQGFQFCYKLGRLEKALTWLEGKGYTHETIYDGEDRPGRHKMSPIMLREASFQKDEVLILFQSRIEYLERNIIEFVCKKIQETPATVR